MTEAISYKLNRRHFLQTGTLTLSGLFWPGPWLAGRADAAAPPQTEVLQVAAFYGEAGNYKIDSHYVIGILSSTQEQTDENALVALRTSLNYRTKVTYNSTDKYKLAFCEAVFDYFIQTQSLQFSAKVLSWNGGSSDLSFGKRSLEKIALYDDLEAHFASQPQKSVLKSHSPYGPSIFFKNSCATALGHQVTPVNARLSNLLQLAGLFSGCILREQKAPPQSQIKAGVINSLKGRLGVGELTRGLNVGNGKFRIS